MHFFCSWRLSTSSVVWYISAIHSLWCFRFGLSPAPSVSFRHMRSYEQFTRRSKLIRQIQKVYLLEYLFITANMSLAAMASYWIGLVGGVLHHFLILFYAPFSFPFYETILSQIFSFNHKKGRFPVLHCSLKNVLIILFCFQNF